MNQANARAFLRAAFGEQSAEAQMIRDMGEKANRPICKGRAMSGTLSQGDFPTLAGRTRQSRRSPRTTAELAAAEPEDALLSRVVALARATGWLVYHQRPMRTASGEWRTGVQGHAGFPDLVLSHPETHALVLAELKAERGRFRPGQQEWLAALAGPGRTVAVWRPSDWEHIEQLLKGEV